MTNTNRIEEAKHILTLIENVDKDDAKTLDEIDARVWCLRHEVLFELDKVLSCHRYYLSADKVLPHHKIKENFHTYPELHLSRDALKAIRLDGWEIRAHQSMSYGKPEFIFSLLKHGHLTELKLLPTEELAELHAIIQSYIWEWKNE